MALDIDTTRAFRSYSQLAALVDAVIGSPPRSGFGRSGLVGRGWA
jgi:hypothetical protein